MRPRKCGWCAVLEVRAAATEHCLPESAGGAFVFVLALAYDESHYREIVSAEMESLGLVIVEYDSKGFFDPLTQDWDDGEIQELNDRLSDECPVQYRTFDCYPREDTHG